VHQVGFFYKIISRCTVNKTLKIKWQSSIKNIQKLYSECRYCLCYFTSFRCCRDCTVDLN